MARPPAPRAGPQQELAAVDAAVAVLVVEIEDALVDLELGDGLSHVHGSFSFRTRIVHCTALSCNALHDNLHAPQNWLN